MLSAQSSARRLAPRLSTQATCRGTWQVPDPFSSKRQEERMTDTTVKKVGSAHSPTGPQGEAYLASGKRVSMRLWRDEEPTQDKPSHKHDYEVVGYVIAGRAELESEGQTVRLEPGDSWVVPAGAEHTYRETFTAVEATAPPAQVQGREQS
jgi:quercetin dioxygenase-like cupin family protein